MYRTLSDLRILRLAVDLEHTLEGYETTLRDAIPEVPVRARLRVLFEDGAGHTELRQALRELAAAAERDGGVRDTEDLLQSLYECESLAHEFYVNQLDRLADPRLVDLFKRLASEEMAHRHAVEEAMRTLGTLRPTHRRGDPVAARP